MKRQLLCLAVIGLLGLAASGVRAASLPIHGRARGAPPAPPAFGLRERLSSSLVRSAWLGDSFHPGRGPALPPPANARFGRGHGGLPTSALRDWKTSRTYRGCDGSVTPIPEPASAALYLVGAGLAAFALRRSRP